MTVTVSSVLAGDDVRTTTAADGTWAVRDQLTPGRYQVRFSVAGVSQWAPQAADRETAEVFTVASGETVTVDDQLVWVPAV